MKLFKLKSSNLRVTYVLAEDIKDVTDTDTSRCTEELLDIESILDVDIIISDNVLNSIIRQELKRIYD